MQNQTYSFTNLHFRFQRQTKGMQEMDSRARLRVQKKKPLKRGKKHLLKTLFDYLKSDTFMYAPLVSLPAHFPSPDTLPCSAEVVELKKTIKENKRFLKQVGDYLKSDDYMYAPLVLPNPSEAFKFNGMINKAVLTRRVTMKVNKPTDHLGNVNQRFESHVSDTDLSGQLPWAQKETVYQICRSMSASGKVTLNSHLRSRS